MKKLNELQSYLTRLRGLMLTLIILCSIGVGNAWGQTTTTYTFTSKSWGATSGGSTANWTSGKDGSAFLTTTPAGLQIQTGSSGANGTSPKSFTNVTQVVITYNSSKNGVGNFKVQIGSNTESSALTITKKKTNGTVTFTPASPQSGKIKITGTCTTNSFSIASVTITEAAATTPTLTVSKASITSGLTYVSGGGPSAAQTFTVSGSDLSANVTVAAPTNFEVSKDGSSYAGSQTITASGTLSATTIYVRLKSGLAVNSYSGNITVASTGATSKTVSLSGSVTAPAYTVVWTINPAAGGTLSTTSGTSTTVTPNSAYTYGSPAYTVTTGSATVSQSTNTFTATPSAICTIRINMVEKPKYTVTLKDNDETLTQASAGAAVTLPSRTGCTGYTFAGWTKTWTEEQDEWTTTAPTIIPAGSYTPSANENLYPVYTKTEGGGTTETTVTETFTNQTSHSSVTVWKQTLTWDASESNASIEWTTYYGKIANGYTEIRTYNDNKMGYLWTSEPITGLKKVKFKGWRVTESDAANMVVSYSTDNDTWYELGTHAATSDNSTFSDEFEITSSDPSTAYYLSIDLSDATCPSSSNKKYRIDDIVITTETGGGSTTSYISVPGCCTNWSTPTVSYSSSLAINASEAVTISSGTTHGAVTYESSDEDVLTVDADGTIHAVGAGTAHIIATWAGDATYCEKSANSNDVTVSGIQVTGTTPVNFGQVYQNAAVANKTIYVTGLGLASPITPSLPVGSPFSFSPASLAKDCSGATLTISASTATLGTYNQTLTLTSGAFSATVTVKMEVIAKPTATFTDALHELTTDKNGASLNSFNLEAAQGTPVVFPTLANQTKSAGTCEGEYYIFAGWTEGDNNTDPQDHLVTSHTLANGDAKHYYAVWADASGSVTYTKLTSNSFSTSAHYVIGAESGGTDYFLYSCEKTDANNSWGLVSSDPATDAPIQFTLSGTASALVAASTEATTRYLKAASGKQFFGMSSSSTTVVLGSGGTIESTADTYNNLRYNSAGGLRWYTGTTTGDAVYFYEVGSSGTVHYRTSCCANKVDAPVVTATTVTSTSITLTWPADVKATGWEVSWNGGAFGAPSGTCTHTVSGLTPNTTYTWKVRATYNAPQCGADTRSGSTTTHQVYHVTYAKGSGTGSCTASGSTTDETGYEAGATVTLQANEFLLSGHTFAGWTEDDEDITISSNQFTMPDHDVVITASWTAKVDKYFDRMHDQTDASHGGVAETEGTNEGKYYILKEGCSYSVPTAVDSKTGDACQTSHYKLRGWIAASYVNSKGEITDESKIFSPGTTKTAGGYTYYAVWAEVVE